MANAIINNYISVLKKCLEFSGRANREEYWWFVAVSVATGIVLQIIDAIIGLPIFGLLFMLAMLLPGIAVAIRRLHDTDRSGWWLLIGLVPILGGLAVLVLMIMPGTDGSNRFGDPSKLSMSDSAAIDGKPSVTQ